jgi:hypothetical protein
MMRAEHVQTLAPQSPICATRSPVTSRRTVTFCIGYADRGHHRDPVTLGNGYAVGGDSCETGTTTSPELPLRGGDP